MEGLVIFLWKKQNSSSKIKIITYVKFFYYLSQEPYLQVYMLDKKGKKEVTTH